MKDDARAYRHILKATALFGSVQGVQLLLSVVRTKMAAVLLGTQGVGILSLLTSTVNMIQSLTGLGIEKGGVRELATHKADVSRISCIITAIRHWSWLSALVGAFIMLLLAENLSRWSFGDARFTAAYLWLSVSLVLDTLTKGELGILQGLRQLRLLAKANLVGSIVGLAVSLLLFHLWGINGIVPAVVGSSVITFLAVVFAGRGRIIRGTTHPIAQTLKQERGVVQLGVMLTVGGFIATLSMYLINIFLSHKAGVNDVGLYRSGFNLIDKYVGLIIVAMVTDYYPRLSAVKNNRAKLNTEVNRQITVALLILSPVVAVFIPLAPIIVRLLLSSEFAPIVPYISWAILGMVFKVPATAIAYVLIVRGNTRAYLITELLSWTTFVALHITGYLLHGLEGMGVAFLFSYVFYFVVIREYCWCKYRTMFNRSASESLGLVALSSFGSFVLCQCVAPVNPVVGYAGCGVLAVVSIWVCGLRLVGLIRK